MRLLYNFTFVARDGHVLSHLFQAATHVSGSNIITQLQPNFITKNAVVNIRNISNSLGPWMQSNYTFKLFI